MNWYWRGFDMSLMISTGLANGMFLTGFREALGDFELRIYAGTEPASADAAIGSATLLVTITDGGTGDPLAFEEDPIDGVLEKSSSQVWQGTAVASGTATFCRLCKQTDTDAASSSLPRLQGDVGIGGKFLNLTSTNISSEAPQRVGALSIAQPIK
jgi:hypothetical protein